jgi:hypothetical protein
MKRGNPFETSHTAWSNRQPELARSLHERHLKELKSLPQVEILPSLEDVKGYFDEQPGGRPDDMTLRDAERLLVSDLWKEYAHDADDAPKDRIRRLLWAVSRKMNGNTNPDEPLRILLRHVSDAEGENDIASRIDPSDTEETEDRLERLIAAKDALRFDADEEGMRSIVDTIEGEFENALNRTSPAFNDKMRAMAERELSDIRVVRDKIYFDILFPNQAKIRNGTRHHRRRPSSERGPIAAE